MTRYLLFSLGLSPILGLQAQVQLNDSTAPTLPQEVELKEASATAKRRGIVCSFQHIENTQTISSNELTRAACCNLGESFTTNPSVDVAQNDASTGARQIRLLGLSGNYLQMMHENIPTLRSASQVYGLSYTPGVWMQNIQVSKGAASVKQGYEGITGQINIDYKKPHDPRPNKLMLNSFADARGRYENNIESTLLLTPKLGTTLLGHYSQNTLPHDGDKDGWADMPSVKQLNLLNRWTLEHGKFFSQLLMRGLSENRRGGQITASLPTTSSPYLINIDTKRIEAFGKTAYILGDKHQTSIALLLSGSIHDQQSTFGTRQYDFTQRNAYASIVYETTLGTHHEWSMGLTLNHDNFSQQLPTTGIVLQQANTPLSETVSGGHLQYTYQLPQHFSLMAGLRLDHSSVYGLFATPRLHLKWTPSRALAVRVNAGKGYRSAHLLAENHNLLAGSRTLQLESDLLRESAWNYGLTTQLRLPLNERILNATLEAYYTSFDQKALVDFDTSPTSIHFYALQGHSSASVLQAELSYPIIKDLQLTAAYRYSYVQNDYQTSSGPQRFEQPLQSRHKALFTASYTTPHNHWQFDLTLQVNGGGRMPLPYSTREGKTSWDTHFKGYSLLSAQITRNFRQLSIYIGGENITNYRQPNAIINVANPWSEHFDPTMIYGPLDGAMLYAGLRYTLAR